MTLHAFKPALVFAGLAWVAAQAMAADGAQSAIDFGCLNCHGAQAHTVGERIGPLTEWGWGFAQKVIAAKG